MTFVIDYVKMGLEQKDKPVFFMEDHVLVGRDRNCDLVIDAITVSRRHAEFVLRDHRWYIKDDSRNGTYVNNQRIPKGVWHQLSHGDWIVFANEEPFYFMIGGKSR